MPERRARAQLKLAGWSALPDDLLSELIRRLPSFAHRARLSSVCRNWRAAWRRHRHPPMPWLARPGLCISLHDAAIHRVLRPEDGRGAACRGSFDNWLALVPAPGPPCRPFLLHSFTTARIDLPLWTQEPIHKIVLSSAPDSGSCIVAALVDTNSESRQKMGICRLRHGSWSSISVAYNIEDIIFYQAKLYALDTLEHLHDFAVHKDDSCTKQYAILHQGEWSARCKPIDYMFVTRYLVECDGRLLMVTRDIIVHDGTRYTRVFNVYALDRGATRCGWAHIKIFDGHTLFVGNACCRAFPTTENDEIRDSCICFSDGELNMSPVIGDELNMPDATFRTVHVCRMRYGVVLVLAYKPVGSSADTGKWLLRGLRVAPGCPWNFHWIKYISV